MSTINTFFFPLKLEICAALATLFLVSPSVYAGCSEESGSGWIVDSKTDATIKKIGTGTIVSCGNIHGAFAGFQKDGFYAGYAICSTNCESGFVPGVTYVKIGKKWKLGKRIGGESSACVVQTGKRRSYCWGTPPESGK